MFTLTILHDEPDLTITIAVDADSLNEARHRTWHFRPPNRVDGPLNEPR